MVDDIAPESQILRPRFGAAPETPQTADPGDLTVHVDNSGPFFCQTSNMLGNDATRLGLPDDAITSRASRDHLFQPLRLAEDLGSHDSTVPATRPATQLTPLSTSAVAHAPGSGIPSHHHQ